LIPRMFRFRRARHWVGARRRLRGACLDSAHVPSSVRGAGLRARRRLRGVCLDSAHVLADALSNGACARGARTEPGSGRALGAR
jgi:hypothetical protein